MLYAFMLSVSCLGFIFLHIIPNVILGGWGRGCCQWLFSIYAHNEIMLMIKYDMLRLMGISDNDDDDDDNDVCCWLFH